MTVDEAKRFFENFFARFETGAPGAYDELWSTRYIGHGSTRDFSLEDVKKTHGGWKKGLPDWRLRANVLCTAGNMITSRVTFSGTHDGVFMGKAPTGKHCEVHGVDVVRVEGGKIAEEWWGFDDLSLLQQLGVVPKLG